MYRFLASPRWIIGLTIAVAAVIAFVSLGLWQLSRLEERRTFNATLTTRLAQPLASLSAASSDPDGHVYRRVVVTGVYAPEWEVLLAARTLDGRPGHHVLTPLHTRDGTLIVDRGWVPFELTDPPIAEAAPPNGEVEVEGVLFPAQHASRSGTFRGGQGLEFVSAVDLDRLADWVDEPVAPLYLLARRQTPPAPLDLPVPGALPEIDEGSHLSYAVQWFLFAAVVTVGFPVLVRRAAHDRAGDTAREEQDA